MSPSIQDRIAAYSLLIDALPRSTEFGVRHDGSSMVGIFSVIDLLRMEFQGHIGALADGFTPRLNSSLDHAANATVTDRSLAYQLVVDAIPRRTEWQNALSGRADGSTPEGIFTALDEVRMHLHIRIGDLIDITTARTQQ